MSSKQVPTSTAKATEFRVCLRKPLLKSSSSSSSSSLSCNYSSISTRTSPATQATTTSSSTAKSEIKSEVITSGGADLDCKNLITNFNNNVKLAETAATCTSLQAANRNCDSSISTTFNNSISATRIKTRDIELLLRSPKIPVLKRSGSTTSTILPETQDTNSMDDTRNSIKYRAPLNECFKPSTNKTSETKTSMNTSQSLSSTILEAEELEGKRRLRLIESNPYLFKSPTNTNNRFKSTKTSTSGLTTSSATSIVLSGDDKAAQDERNDAKGNDYQSDDDDDDEQNDDDDDDMDDEDYVPPNSLVRNKIVRHFSADQSVVEVLVESQQTSFEPKYVKEINFEVLKMPNSHQKIGGAARSYSSEVDAALSSQKSSSSRSLGGSRSKVKNANPSENGSKTSSRKKIPLRKVVSTQKRSLIKNKPSGVALGKLKPTNLADSLKSAATDLEVAEGSRTDAQSSKSGVMVCAPRPNLDTSSITSVEDTFVKLKLDNNLASAKAIIGPKISSTTSLSSSSSSSSVAVTSVAPIKSKTAQSILCDTRAVAPPEPPPKVSQLKSLQYLRHIAVEKQKKEKEANNGDDVVTEPVSASSSLVASSAPISHATVSKSNQVCLITQSGNNTQQCAKTSESSRVDSAPLRSLGATTQNRTESGVQQPPTNNSGAESGGQDRSNKMITIKKNSYQLLGPIGQGGSAVVYQVFDPKNRRLLAVKVVDLSRSDASVVLGYKNEIKLLYKLRNCERVVRMVSYEFRNSNRQLLIVMEKGDNDLANVIKGFAKSDGSKLSPHLIRFYWHEMLKAVNEIHQLNIVHLDLKPVNFILVSGKLKLIDFGIANAIQSNKTSVLKDSIIGTVDFMAPESFQKRSYDGGKSMVKCNRKADIWSLGIILYNLVYGHTPFAHIKDNLEKLYAITHDSIRFAPINDDPLLLDVIKCCLTKDAALRPSAAELLNHRYLMSSQLGLTNHEYGSRSPPIARSLSLDRPRTTPSQSNDPSNGKIPSELLSQLSALTPTTFRNFSKMVQSMSSSSAKQQQ